MSRSFRSEDKLVGNILGNFERRLVLVPRFQRGFSWEKTQVAAFGDDTKAFEEDYRTSPTSATYFLGPIVIEDKDEEIVLLDGQQRLATITILLAAIRDVARTLGTQNGNDFARDVQSKLIEKEDVDDEYALHLGELDKEFFRKTVQDDPPKKVAAILRSHVRIAEAYKMLKSEILERINGKSSAGSLQELKSIRDSVIKGMTLVAINVENESDAFSIFETLNDRGLRLSVPDLLLNLLMQRAKNAPERDRVRKKWNYMLEQMGKRDISRFLRHMWLSRYGDLKARGLFAELKNRLISKKISSLDFVEGCSSDCDSYISLIDQKGIPKEAINGVSGLIRYMGITSSLPMMLSALQCLKQADFIKLVDYTAGLGLRYSLISNLNPSTLESAFYQIARDIRGKHSVGESSSRNFKAAMAILAKLNPSDQLVEERATEASFDRAPALWLMTQIANSRQSATKEIAVHYANLEHIFPQNATQSEWPNKKHLEDYLWRLGNLTILGEKLNRDSANKSFLVKSKNYYKKSEINIAKDILKFPVWTPKEVDVRGKRLARLLIKIFPA